MPATPAQAATAKAGIAAAQAAVAEMEKGANVSTLRALLTQAQTTLGRIMVATPPPPPPPPPPKFAVDDVPAQSGVEGKPMTPVALSATGGEPPYTFAVAGQPAGTALVEAELEGTPSVNGEFTVAVGAADSSNPPLIAKASFPFTVAPAQVSPPPPPGKGLNTKLLAKTGAYTVSSGVAQWKAVNALMMPAGVPVSPMGWFTDYGDGTNWDTMADPTWWIGNWNAGGTSPIARPMFGIVIIPAQNVGDMLDSEKALPWHLRHKAYHRRTGQRAAATGGATLEQGANGAFNAHYVLLAQRLVAGGWIDAALRLGWEMNGNWFAWSAIGQQAAWIEYWHQIVTSIRSVPGTAKIEFVLNPTMGDTGAGDLATYEPAADEWDLYGFDTYDNNWGSYPGAAAAWQQFETENFGLEWLVAASKRTGKPMCFPESGRGWGVNPSTPGGIVTPAEGANQECCGGDNALFVTNMLEFVESQNVVEFGWWNDENPNPPTGILGPTNPLMTAAFQAQMAIAS